MTKKRWILLGAFIIVAASLICLTACASHEQAGAVNREESVGIEPSAEIVAQADGTLTQEQIDVIEQQETFGEEGTLAKKRETLLKPIQDKVAAAIQNYAKSNNATIVLDVASNPTVMYYDPSADKTNDIINLVK